MAFGLEERTHDDVVGPAIELAAETKGAKKLGPNLAWLAFSRTLEDGARIHFYAHQGVVLDIIETSGPVETVPVSDVEKLARIKIAVSEATDLPLEVIEGQERLRPYVEARHVVAYLGRKHTGLSYPLIARDLGGRDHTTIINGERRVLEADENSNIAALLRTVELNGLMDDVMSPETRNSVATTLVTATSEGIWEYPTELIRPSHADLLGVAEGSFVHDVDGRERPHSYEFYLEQAAELFGALGSAATASTGQLGSNIVPVAFMHDRQGVLPLGNV
jgi:hypothetical protein